MVSRQLYEIGDNERIDTLLLARRTDDSESKLYIVGISNALLFQGGTLRRDAIVPVDAKQ